MEKELNSTLSNLRKNYASNELTEDSIDKNPFKQFEKWFNEALDSDVLEPNAMSIATSGKDNIPSIRTVLLKYFDEKGFTFFTNYESKKATQISENENVALLFTWLPLERQIKIQGKACKIPTSESLKYFLSRPKGSQIGAWVSKQSSITTRSLLANKFAEMKSKFEKGEVPLPSFWGGYCVEPHTIEFWQGRPSRLHDRIQFERQDNGDWNIERLAP